MRRAFPRLRALQAAILSGLLAAGSACAAAPASKYPPSSAEVIAAAPAATWKPIPAENLLRMEVAGGGVVVIELAPPFAPLHIKNVRELVRQKWFDGHSIVRVRDNYVAQWGGPRDDREAPKEVTLNLPAEYDQPLKGVSFTPLPFVDSYAPRVGFVDTWPAAADSKSVWLTHCYGAVAVGRGNAPDTGSGIELYAVIGHATRHLDRNLAVIGRVLEGMEVLSSLPRGAPPQGNYERAQYVPIVRIQGFNASDADAPRFEVLRSNTPTFTRYVSTRANRLDQFFVKPAGGVDICNVQIPVRRLK